MKDIIIKSIEEREALVKSFAQMINYYNTFDELTAHIYNKQIYKRYADELFASKQETYSDLEKDLLNDYREYLSSDISNKNREIIDTMSEFLREQEFKVYLQMIPQNCRYSVFFALILEQISQGSEISLNEIINIYIENAEKATDEEAISLVAQSKKIAINRERILKNIYDSNNVSYIYRSFTDSLDEEPEIIEKEEVEFVEEVSETFKSKFTNLLKKRR